MTAPIDNRPLASLAYERLLEEIVRGKRPMGERISEESIAQELGISRTPAREALMQLSADGLVERIARKGCRIAPLDLRQQRDRFECRAMLERLALDLGFEGLDRVALRGIEAQLLAARDARASLAADERLHDLILQACPNRSLVEIIRRLQQQCRVFRAFRAMSQPAEQLTAERLEIDWAMLRGEREQVGELLTRHILNGSPGEG